MPCWPDASCAAILVPGVDLDVLLERADRALGRRYVRTSERLPGGYRAAPDEWIGALVGPLGEPAGVLLVPADLGEVFVVALKLSSTVGDAGVIAWRGFMHSPAVMKRYVGGRPLWREGPDPDHEVGWAIPGRDAILPGPQPDFVPPSPEAFADVLGPRLRRYRDAVIDPAAGEQHVAWIRRDSPLSGI